MKPFYWSTNCMRAQHTLCFVLPSKEKQCDLQHESFGCEKLRSNSSLLPPLPRASGNAEVRKLKYKVRRQATYQCLVPY